MRGEDAVLDPAEGVVLRHRLGLEDVDSRVAELALFERLCDRVLIHHAAACGVDEDRAVLHFGDRLLVDQVQGAFVQRTMYGDNVAFFEQGVEVDEGGVDLAVAANLQGLHVEGEGDALDGFSDRAVADDAERLARELTQREHKGGEGRAVLPAALVDEGVVAPDAAHALEYQREGMLTHGVGAVGAGVADGDAVRFTIRNINVVVPCGEQTDVFQVVCEAQGLCVQGRFVADDHVRVAHSLGNLVIRRELTDNDLAELLQGLEAQVALSDGFGVGQDDFHSDPSILSFRCIIAESGEFGKRLQLGMRN